MFTYVACDLLIVDPSICVCIFRPTSRSEPIKKIADRICVACRHTIRCRDAAKKS